ncbi:hypothetical protein OG874_44040 [Nocardia sp. NBC_00565]|uniref:hypothetical protein n=1 Tax=Nocardia sp. NBC_00565 TaxID=2975993 RepID=UPI002E80CC8D|nr:hypothetical protein [Nocardia sp. NBC_00565]WUC03539.1 hypothetical protein OG874_44040 [Nocardia sp. NBC_00565]
MDDVKSQLDVLLRDYDLARNDERNLTALYFTTFSIAIATLGLLGGLLFRALDSSKPPLEDFVLVGAPLIPLCLFIHLLTMAPAAVARAFYARLLERQIQSIVDMHGPYPGLRFPSFVELNVIFSRFTRRTFYRTVIGLLATLILILFLGMTMVLILKTHHAVSKFIAAPFYALTTFLVVSNWIGLNRRGREFFAQVLHDYPENRRDSLQPSASATKSSGTRSLVGYLLLPRPADLSKALFFPASVGISCLLTDQTVHGGIRFVVMWLTLELLIYAARYQVNDIRGASEDGRAPEKRARGRPAMTPSAMKLSAGVIALRLYMVFLIAITPSLALSSNIRWALGGVVGTAAVYEFARSVERREYEKSEHPARGTIMLSKQNRIAAASVLLLVGLGYPLRTALGLLFVPTETIPVQVFVGMLFFTFSFGILFVSMTWALEAVSYLSELPRAGTPPQFHWSLLEKPHLVLLVRAFRWPVLHGTTTPLGEERIGARKKIFHQLYDTTAEGATSSALAPWNVALAGCAVAVAVLLSGASVSGWRWVAFGLAIAGLAVAVVVLSMRAVDRIACLAAVLPVVASIPFALGATAGTDLEICAVAAIGWVLAAGMTFYFKNSTYADVLGFVDGLSKLSILCAGAVLTAIFGKNFADSFPKLKAAARAEAAGNGHYLS